MHQVYEYTAKEVDPITFEVIRHRLLSITDEQASTLASVSGSALVNEATDFNTGLYRAFGEVVTMGKTVTFHAASLSLMVKHVIEDCEDTVGINPGDMFIVNHPHKGALHCPDVGVLAPIFVDGRRIGWTGACAHQLDVGGMVPGSFASMAKDIRQEGMLIPPVKIIDRGELRSDVLNFITGMSRLPTNISLDLKGLMAANNIGVKSLLDTIAKYGVDTVLTVMDGMMSLSETKMRKRLKELPDGVFRAQAFLDHDGFDNKIYKIHVELRKQGDRIVFDYTGSDAQAPGFVNATRTGLLAGVYAGILPVIAYDLSWNEGLLRPLEVLSTEGSIVSCRFPAPCSQGPLGAMWLVEVTTTEVISKLMATHPDYLAEAQSSPASGPDLFHIHGRNQYGEPATAPILEVMLSGGGAYAHRDGVSVSGQRNITAGRAPNVETTELKLPVLYMYRRIITDSSGAGRNVGGQAAGAAFVLHGVDEVESLVACHGYQSPTSRGLFGGYPSGCNHRRFLRHSNIRQLLADGVFPDRMDGLEGEEVEFNAKPPEFEFGKDDVYECNPTAGGGWGDPLDRPAGSVAADVAAGAFSARVAERIFGVLIQGGGLDEAATTAARAAIRRRRLAWPAGKALAVQPQTDGAEPVAIVGDVARIVRAAGTPYLVCNSCDTAIAPAAENWKDYARHHLATPEDLGPRVRIHHDLEVVQHACPHCATLLDVEVRRKGEASLFDIQVAA
ncbi:hydantoinase B/oxoprolinase family protein [Pigmentiphaga sp.]|uniref:hydantoinase B/oxoprolinase family protein n=1 Tax=Pigmentiphaga sp. TaxID=1977564 RepID=UPI00128DF461|nr:hydantoinase B/oxoprolinase family protein [Pigmentiphaga sp.]MPS25511.1 hydantoinase B/oxoprolinase family protein [Alcaligenaceae bacterium SAGV5]MPS54125.1 hydantoinase B/oxoprolinase family protein [Alcaligenaceae bacterium SAGV3]MPT58824.1 hydantoinase B/oxoprolinase family protein [Alcaligenaceae bacterium]